MAGPRLRFARVTGALVAALVFVACTRGGDRGADETTTTAPGPLGDTPALAPPPTPDRARGGVVRVALHGEPDPAAPTLAGAAARALVLPQLFLARPDGRWEALLVEPGSDRLAPDGRTATFRLRAGAAWSDGTPLTAADLARTADPRFVERVEATPGGGVNVTFTHRLPGWRRLWSGADSIAAPRAGVWGGPFAVASLTPGLETVLRPNPHWPGPGPFLDALHLVVVPDADVQRRLLEAGEVDVVMPFALTHRTAQLDGVAGARTATAERSGWWLGLVLSPKLDVAKRRAVVATVDRGAFVGTLLRGEATVLDGFAGPEDATWKGSRGWSASGIGKVVLTGTEEDPMTGLLQRAMQKVARAASGELELRNAQADEVDRWLADGEYEAAIVPRYDGPDPCWRCRWSDVHAELARRADEGDVGAAVAVEQKLRDDARLLPLWRGRVVVAWRDGVEGVSANGYALSAAWDAWRWFRD